MTEMVRGCLVIACVLFSAVATAAGQCPPGDGKDSSVTGMHIALVRYMNSGCALECSNTPTSHCVAW